MKIFIMLSMLLLIPSLAKAATVTYYFNSYTSPTGSGSWSNLANLVDSDPDTYAYYSYTSTPVSTGYVTCNGNTSGSYLGVITKVEFRWRARGAGAGGPSVNTYGQPIFGGSSAGTLRTFVAPPYITYSSWYDITSDVNAPTWGTNWSHINNLDVKVGSDALGGAYGYLAYMYIVEVRVTYEPFLPAQVID